MAEISPLRRQMIEDMMVRNLSPATQQSYLSAVSKFSRYFGRSPDRLGLEDVHAFQVHLVATGIQDLGGHVGRLEIKKAAGEGRREDRSQLADVVAGRRMAIRQRDQNYAVIDSGGRAVRERQIVGARRQPDIVDDAIALSSSALKNLCSLHCWAQPVGPTPKRTRVSAVASPVHEFPDFGDNDGTFTNRGSNALDRSRPHIADRKDSRA
jgi:hypothetical protein